ncbi:hypothetical protein GIB67_030764 [Kingdonia uniflora]|uniref:Uncharacterized protein n=1 Tax=Kingdonia uniflora TaxID=39325 RepID=A0A7J7L2Y8_9MAGN|nr:hypothetical protein GIB67_030764 [Kingdonia uniflora]
MSLAISFDTAKTCHPQPSKSSPPVADVRSLTHYGEPYDGNTRYFRSTLFVAAVRACYGESCLLHGVEWMPSKGGVTEEQMLNFMGANTHLSPLQAKKLLEDENIGFAYISQREAHPSLYSLVALREHIKKCSPIATAEKVQQFVKARGKEAIVSGFYHEGYEDPLLMLMRRRGVDSGLVVKVWNLHLVLGSFCIHAFLYIIGFNSSNHNKFC